MSTFAANDPIGQRHGIALFSAQTTWGTPVTPATGIGIATLTWNILANPVYPNGPGSPDPITERPGATLVEWRLEFEAIQTGMKALLLDVQRSGGLVPLLTLGLGAADDTGTPVVHIDQIQDCKTERLSISVDPSNGHGPVTGSMNGKGTLLTRLTAGAAALLSTTPWMTQDAILTRAAAAYEARSISFEIANNISSDYSIPGSSPTRFPRSFTEHDRTFSGEITRYADAGPALQGSTLTPFAQVLTLTNPVDSVVLTATWANVTYGSEERRLGRDGYFSRTPFRARGLTLA